MAEHDPFYVGYQARTSRTFARTSRASAGVLATVCVLVAVGAMALQSSPGDGRWLDASPRTWTGVMTTSPYPLLIIDEGDTRRTAIVVGFGKRGADDRARAFEGRVVEIAGTLIERDGRMLIELLEDEGAIRAIGPHQNREPPTELGRATVQGEVIDPKCYLGAMKPGSGKTHRACAIRCVAGGIPPMLVSRGAGGAEYHLLTSAAGGAINDAILPYVGDVVTIHGRVSRMGDLLMLAVDAEGIQRVDDP